MASSWGRRSRADLWPRLAGVRSRSHLHSSGISHEGGLGMASRARCSALIIVVTVLLLGSPSSGLASVRSVFDLDNPDGGPFPSDRFTVTDESNITGLRVALPLPDCTARPTDCDDLRVVNTLDGFNVTPRISIPFDGPIDLSTVNSRTVFFVRLGNTRHNDDDREPSARIGINQIVWDPDAHLLHANSHQLLDQ